jgi:hypothetical protein
VKLREARSGDRREWAEGTRALARIPTKGETPQGDFHTPPYGAFPQVTTMSTRRRQEKEKIWHILHEFRCRPCRAGRIVDAIHGLQTGEIGG